MNKLLTIGQERLDRGEILVPALLLPVAVIEIIKELTLTGYCMARCQYLRREIRKLNA